MRISFIPFDGSKKEFWLMVDFSGFFYTWVAMVVVVFLSAIFLNKLTGIDLLANLAFVSNLINEWCGVNWSFPIMLGATLVPPFVLVFVCRINLMAFPRRPIRYFCRWL